MIPQDAYFICFSLFLCTKPFQFIEMAYSVSRTVKLKWIRLFRDPADALTAHVFLKRRVALSSILKLAGSRCEPYAIPLYGTEKSQILNVFIISPIIYCYLNL